jgi:hypothetical protein
MRFGVHPKIGICMRIDVVTFTVRVLLSHFVKIRIVKITVRVFLLSCYACNQCDDK